MVLGQATLGSLRPRGDNLSSLFPSNTLVLHIRKRSPSSSPSLHLSLGKYSCTTNLFPSRLLREGEVVFQRLSHLLSQYAFPAATWLTSWTCYHSRERGRDTRKPCEVHLSPRRLLATLSANAGEWIQAAGWRALATLLDCLFWFYRLGGFKSAVLSTFSLWGSSFPLPLLLTNTECCSLWRGKILLLQIDDNPSS